MIVTIGKYNIDIGSWNTLTGHQLISFCRYFNKSTDPAYMKVKLLMLFCGIKLIRKKLVRTGGKTYQWFRQNGHKILISTDSINIISEAILKNFFREDDNGNYILDSSLMRNIIPSFRIGLRKYTGPADGLTNITYKEFIHTETNYHKFMDNGYQEYIDKMIAVLFRPRKRFLFIRKRLNNYNGDDRIRFNDFHIDNLAKHIRKLDPTYKQAIQYFYIGCRRFIMNYFSWVFAPGGGIIKTDIFNMHLEIIDALAKSQPAEKEKIREQLLYDVLDSLNNIAKNANKLMKNDKKK